MTPKRTRRKRSGSYLIGRGRPPEHTRFKPGQSGNPKGRPRGRKNTDETLYEELNRKIEITVGGKKQFISKRDAIIIAQIHKALKGDAKATQFVLDREGEIADTLRPINEVDSKMTPAEVYQQMVKAGRRLA